MEKANVPLVPGYHGEQQDADFLHTQADRIGYPVLLKASPAAAARACA
jgi:3-methylcrotonyl-CoA carboxylase alpha subunit